MNNIDYVKQTCINAKSSSKEISCLSESKKNLILKSLIDEINLKRDDIKDANSKDIESLKVTDNFNNAFVDRLLIDDVRIDSMISSISEIIAFKDPVGEITNIKEMSSGIKVGKMSMPLGVIAMKAKCNH